MSRPPTRATRALIEAAWRGGADIQQTTPTSPLYLATGGKRLRLSDARGNLTAAGRFYQGLGDAAARAVVRRRLDTTQEARKVGNGYQIQVDGKWRWVRQGDRVTRLGAEYYAAREPTRYIVVVPGLQHRRFGTSAGAERDVPSSAFMSGEIELPADVPPSEVEQRLRAIVLEAMDGLARDGPDDSDIILMMDSDPIYYRPTGRWTFSQQTYVNEDGPPTFASIVNRPLRGCHVAPPDVFAAYGLTPSALRDTQGRCVPAQLEELTDQPPEAVARLFDLAFDALSPEDREAGYGADGGWRELGCTAQLIKEYARLTRRCCYVHHAGHCILRFTPPDRDRHLSPLCFSIAGDHAFFVEDEGALRSAQKMAAGRRRPPPKARLERPRGVARKDRVPDPTEQLWWPPLDGDPEPGREYHAEADLEELRKRLEQEGRQVLGVRRATKKRPGALRLADGVTIVEAADRRAWRDVLPWHGDLEDLRPYRRHYTEDIEAVRQSLHERGVVPSVSMANEHKIRSLRLPNRERTEIVQRPQMADELQRWHEALLRRGYDHADVLYTGQSEAAYANAVAMRLARTTEPRKATPTAWREAATDEARCADCGEPLPPRELEVDHRVPLRSGGAHAPGNLQALCRPCHLRKTLHENLIPGEDNVMASVFAPAVFRAFHESAKPPQIVTMRRQPSGQLQAWQFDVKSCRRNALERNEHPVPVFSPLDVPRPAAPGDTSPDYFWVDRGDRRPEEWTDRTYWEAIGLYCGPRWMWKGAVAEALEAGVLRWEDVKLSLTATSHLPCAFFKDLFGRMEEAWADGNPDVSFKRPLLAMLGIWNKPDRAEWSCETLADDHDSSFVGPVRRRPLDVAGQPGVLHDLLWKTELLSYRSMRPVGQIALDMEGAYLHRLVRLARPFLTRNPRQRYEILGAVVDCIYVEAPRRVLRDLARAVAAVTHSDGTPLFHHKAQGPPEGYPEHFPSVSQPRPEVADEPWIDHVETDAVEASELLGRLVLEGGQSCFLAGLAGTGKSVAARELVRALRDRGEVVEVLAFTNQAARGHAKVSGRTIHHFLHRSPNYSGWIFVDEASQLPLPLFARLMQYRLAGCKFVFIGDFEGQLPAAYDTWRCDPVPPLALKDSGALKALCDRNRVTFTRCRRSDAELFGIYAKLPSQGLDEALARLRAEFPLTDQLPDWELTIYHKHRVRLCLERNRRDAEAHPGPKLDVQLPCGDPQAPAPIAAQLFPGVRLLGLRNEKRFYNGSIYEVLAATREAGVAVRDLDSGETLRLGLHELHRVTLAGALVIYSVQGRTLPGRVRVYTRGASPELGLNVRMLTVAVSRATSKALVEVE